MWTCISFKYTLKTLGQPLKKVKNAKYNNVNMLRKESNGTIKNKWRQKCGKKYIQQIENSNKYGGY